MYLLICHQETDEEERAYKALSNPLKVCITAAESPVCYNLIPALTCGDCFGKNTEISLRLLGSPDAEEERIKGVAMEAMDLSQGLFRNVEVNKHNVKDCC